MNGAARGLVTLAPVLLPLLSTAHADPLKLAPGAPVVLACQTQSAVLIPEAASTTGEMRLKLEAAAAGADAGAKGTWSVTALAAAHTASFAARDLARCKSGCDLIAAAGRPIELWSPRRIGPEKLPAGEPLTVITIDPATLKLTASTTISNAIAALEKGECKLAECGMGWGSDPQGQTPRRDQGLTLRV